MKVLHVNDADLRGARFSGYALLDDLRSRGVDGTQVVLSKQSADDRVTSLYAGPHEEALRDSLRRVEKRHGMDGILYPWARVLAASSAFRAADVVHYHLWHNRMFSVLDVPSIFTRKPSVWTLHDPWALTGHCVHPLQCAGWRTGCAPCPFLDRWFEMDVDCAGAMWNLKREAYARLQPDVIVTSEFMLSMVRESPLTAHFEHVHLVPFGVSTGAYLADSERHASRAALGVPADHYVVMLRAATGAAATLKGMAQVIRALSLRPPDRPTTILTVDAEGALRIRDSGYNVVDLGWVEPGVALSRALCASDAFLMPSLGESFGLMALEAMAAGRPVICFDQTAVATLTEAPECGLAVPFGDAAALRDAVDQLGADPGEAARRGRLGKEIARRDYDQDRYLDALLGIYQEALARGHA